MQRHRAGLQPCEVEHLIDMVQKNPALIFNLPCSLLDPLAGLLPDQSGHPKNDGQGGPKLVSNIAVESGFHVIQLLQAIGLPLFYLHPLLDEIENKEKGKA